MKLRKSAAVIHGSAGSRIDAMTGSSLAVPAGGISGEVLATLAQRYLGRAGSYIVVVSLVVASFVMATRITVRGMLHVGGELARRLAALAGALSQGVQSKSVKLGD